MWLQKRHLLLFFSYASEALEHVRKLKVYAEQYAWLCCGNLHLNGDLTQQVKGWRPYFLPISSQGFEARRNADIGAGSFIAGKL